MAESAIDTNAQVMSPQVTQQSAAVPAPRPEQANQGHSERPCRDSHCYIYFESTGSATHFAGHRRVV